VTRLILWDVDHTLIENSGVSKDIYSAAFRLLNSVEAFIPAVTNGKTDRLIMRDMFKSNDVATPAWPLIEAALAAAGIGNQENLKRRGYILPGAIPILESLEAAPDVVQTVVTGNIRQNAMLKLSTFGLDPFFNFATGGYGADSEARDELVRLARIRSEEFYDSCFSAANTIVIGDTPRDVLAAHLGGARIVAVATGRDSEADLRAAGADVVVPDLGNSEATLKLILE
jgi:phosphoglycolate phosphatase-like HAD superfamily hydrolase